MKCRVVELYRLGKRISKEEALTLEPILGELVIDDLKEENAAGRPLRRAILYDPSTIKYMGNVQKLVPLFEPIILRMNRGDGGFVLRGWQISTEHVDEKCIRLELAQEWWIRPVA